MVRHITLPNGVSLTDLRADGPEDARALLDTIKGMAGMGFVANTAPASTETLGQRIALYLEDLRNARLSEGNLRDADNTLTIFRELTGADVPMVGVSDHHVRRFLSEIQHWPRNARKLVAFKDLAAGAIIQKAKRLNAAAETEQDKIQLLSKRTLDKHRDRLASFFNAQVASGVRDKSPLDGIKRHSATAADESSRRAFTIEELEKTFGLATFLPWAAKQPDRYWGPLIGVSTGARVNEVAQLYLDDIEEITGAWGIKFRRGRPDQKIKKGHRGPLRAATSRVGGRRLPGLPQGCENGGPCPPVSASALAQKSRLW